MVVMAQVDFPTAVQFNCAWNIGLTYFFAMRLARDTGAVRAVLVAAFVEADICDVEGLRSVLMVVGRRGVDCGI
jgi:hypothetical protein